MVLTNMQSNEIQGIYDNLIFELINLKKSTQNIFSGMSLNMDVAKPTEKMNIGLQRVITHKLMNREIEKLDVELQPLANKISVAKVTSTDHGDAARYKISSDDPYVRVLLAANDRFIRNIDYNQRNIFDTAVVNLASLLENTMKQLAQFTMLTFPEKFSVKEQSKLTLMNVLNSDNVEELKEEVLQRYFADLTYDSVDEWLPKLLKSVSGKKAKNNDIAMFKELFERRNVIVHNKSVVNTTYLDKVDTSVFTKGDLIITNSNYIDNLITGVIGLTVSLLDGALANWGAEGSELTEFLANLNDAALPFYDEQQYDFGIAYYKNLRNVARSRIGKTTMGAYGTSYNYYLGLKAKGQLDTPEMQSEVKRFFDYFKDKDWWANVPFENTVLPEASLTKSSVEFAQVLVQYAEGLKRENDASLAKVLSWPMTGLVRDEATWNAYLNDFYKQIW